MDKIKVGYLPLYIQLYDDSDPHYRDPMVSYMAKLTNMIESHGIELVQADQVCRTKPEFEAAVKKFNDAGVVAVITQHLAYSPSLESIDALLSLEMPIIVFDTTMDCSFLDRADHYNGSTANHGIHGVQDMCSMLKRYEKPYYLCVGHADNSDVVEEVVGMCRAAMACNAFRTVRVGSAGGSFHGMGDFLVSDERMEKDLGVQVKYMTPQLIQEYLAQVTESQIDDEIKKDQEKYDVEVTFQAEYRGATKVGLAMRKWMEDEKLTAFTMNFLAMDKIGVPKVPFPECCKVMERGMGYAGEGDVLTASLMRALLQVYPNTAFTEMFSPDWEKDVIYLSHMGESNPNLAQWKPLLTDMPFQWNSCGNTVGMYTCFRPGKAVWVNLAPMKDHFKLILSQGELLDMDLRNSIYRKTTQGWYKPNKPVKQFLKEFSMIGGTHHSVLVYDVDIRELEAFGQMMGFEVTVI